MGRGFKSPGARHRPIAVHHLRTHGIRRMDHVGIVVDDLADAIEFFVELGVVLQGEGPVEGRVVGSRAYGRMLRPDGTGRLEQTKFHLPSNQGDNRRAPANPPRIRHVAFAVQNIDTVVAGPPNPRR